MNNKKTDNSNDIYERIGKIALSAAIQGISAKVTDHVIKKFLSGYKNGFKNSDCYYNDEDDEEEMAEAEVIDV